MKLRQALKVCKILYDNDGHGKFRLRFNPHTARTVSNARRVCQRGKRWLKDRRIPYIPSEDDLREQLEIRLSIFSNLLKQLEL